MTGIDLGDTFTDLSWPSGGVTVDRVLRVPSTPDDPSRGLIDARDAGGIDPLTLDIILHGTTIATNAPIERKGARTALITTRGFRAFPELGRRDRQRMYGRTGTQDPLIPRRVRREVRERMDHRDCIVAPLEKAQLARLAGLAAALAGEGIETVATSSLHSHADPAHELRHGAIMRAANPDREVVISSEVVGDDHGFERMSTAAVQGNPQPPVARYARSLTARRAARGFARQTWVMQSNGDLAPLSQLGGRRTSCARARRRA